MGRLTIEQIIEHCEKTTKQYEEKVSDLFPVERIQSKTYWEHKQVAEYLKELQKYKDLEEQGRLIELPCAVGDTVYFITQNAEREYIIGSGRFSCSWLDYPRTIYTTKEEAEAKLEELKGE